jgi:ABC-type nitrate/sulfonate/bicarbonate transport system substrate-binding protein
MNCCRGEKLDLQTALKRAVGQLRGKRIITTKGSDMEQIVLSALDKAGLKPSVDVKMSHAPSADGLRAFLAEEADAYSGGLTERTEARRHGGTELVTSAHLLPPVIDGRSLQVRAGLVLCGRPVPPESLQSAAAI